MAGRSGPLTSEARLEAEVIDPTQALDEAHVALRVWRKSAGSRLGRIEEASRQPFSRRYNALQSTRPAVPADDALRSVLIIRAGIGAYLLGIAQNAVTFLAWLLILVSERGRCRCSTSSSSSTASL